MLVEIITAILLLCGIYLLTISNKYGFVLLAIQNITLGYIAYESNLTVLVMLEIIFLMMNTEGFLAWHWNKQLPLMARYTFYVLVSLVGCVSIYVFDKDSHSWIGLVQVIQLLVSIYGQYLVNKNKNGFSYWVVGSFLMLILCYGKMLVVLFMASVVTLALNVKGSINFKLQTN